MEHHRVESELGQHFIFSLDNEPSRGLREAITIDLDVLPWCFDLWR